MPTINPTDLAVLDQRLAQAEVPTHVRGGLARYLLYRIPPGAFLMAVLENDLAEAVRCADVLNLADLLSIVQFLDNDVERTAWGSPAIVAAWLQQRSASSRAAW